MNVHFQIKANDWISSLGGLTSETPRALVQPLKALGASFVGTACRYEGAMLRGADETGWTKSIEAKSDRDRSICVTARFRPNAVRKVSSGLALAFRFDSWDEANYVFVPGALYAGNRFRCRPVEYAPKFPTEDRRPDIPVTITDVPRLSNVAGPSEVELRTSSMTCPSFGVYFPKLRKALLVLVPDRTDLGQNGIVIQESDDRRHAVVVLTSPGIRRLRYGGMHLEPSSDQAANIEVGHEISLTFRAYLFDTDGPKGLLDRFMRVRKNLLPAKAKECVTPYSFALDSEIALQNRMRWFKPGGYFKNGNGDSPFGHIQLGWVGGLMSTYPMLTARTEPGFHRSLVSIDTTLKRLSAPSGFLYGMYRDGVVYGDNFEDNLKEPEIAMVRKNGDGLYYLLKQLAILKPNEIRPEWDVVARRWADAFVSLWRRYRQFGQLVNVKTGAIDVGGSTAGAIVPAALALASERYHDADYIEVAQESARMMAKRDLDKGYTTGGPGEILQCPDSESAFALLESMVVLFEVTKKTEWLNRAKEAAALCSSWVMAYDFPFPPGSELARAKVRSTGAVWASVQNKHAAPGICSASGDSLIKLYRATGDPVYLDLLEDIAHGILEFMSRHDRPIGSNQDGFVNERVNTSDWEGDSGVGAVGDSSVSWCELAIMLTCTDLPGVYVDLDRHRVWCLDHVHARLIRGRTIALTNPTSLPAKVRILAEERRSTESVAWQSALAGARVLELAPGETKTIVLPAGETTH